MAAITAVLEIVMLVIDCTTGGNCLKPHFALFLVLCESFAQKTLASSNYTRSKSHLGGNLR